MGDDIVISAQAIRITSTCRCVTKQRVNGRVIASNCPAQQEPDSPFCQGCIQAGHLELPHEDPGNDQIWMEIRR